MRHNKIPRPEIPQAQPNHLLEQFAPIAYTPPRIVCCLLDYETRKRTCRGDGVVLGGHERTWGLSFAGVAAG